MSATTNTSRSRQMSPLRVAVTLEQCWHRVPGGTATSILELVNALVALAEEPTDTAGRPLELIGVSARHSGPPQSPWVPPISVASLGLPRRLLYETWHVLRRPQVERATGPVDVIHATALAMPPRTVPIVATLHDVAFRRHPDQFTRNGLHFFEAALRCMQRDASIVLCPSQVTADDAVAAGISAERIRVVPWGVNAPEVNDDQRRSIRRRFGLPERFVLHIGTAEPRKNRAAVVRAAESLPRDVAVVLVGPEGWGDENIAVDDKRIIRLGFVADADKWALLAEASIFCYPSVWEGFGLPVLEALAVGTPVVTSKGTSTEEVAGDAAILIDPTDTHDIAEALSAVLDDESLRRRLSAGGPKRAAEFSWVTSAQATAAAYRDAAAS